MNLAEIIDPHPADAIALRSVGETTTYGELRSQVDAMRGGLIELGLSVGDRVALITASNWYFVVTYLAVLGAGAVAVPLNPSSPTPELQRELDLVRPRFAVVGPTGSAAFASVDRVTAGIEHVLCPEGVELPASSSLEDRLLGPSRPRVDRDADDPAVLLFTSGTAGSPKAAVLSHGNLVANLDQMQAVRDAEVGPGDVVLCVLPLFHIYGLNAVLGLGLRAGASIVLVQRFDAASCAQIIRDQRVTVVAGVPSMYDAWCRLPVAPHDAFRTVRRAVSGAARLEPADAAQFHERFGVRIEEGYGLTEASPTVTAAGPTTPRAATIGMPVPGVEVRLVDEQGSDVLAGDPGEIWVRGPNVFRGYWEDPEASARALTHDGWLRTGDVAVVDDDGYLTLVDRAKDLIIISGFNVYPAEVEDVLLAHPGISEAAVVGVPSPETGEAVKAFVVAQPDRVLEEDEIMAFCAGQLARYKCPSKVVFVSTLPRGLGGKLVRRELAG